VGALCEGKQHKDYLDILQKIRRSAYYQSLFQNHRVERNIRTRVHFPTAELPGGLNVSSLKPEQKLWSVNVSVSVSVSLSLFLSFSLSFFLSFFL
jgi:hypothetical protein